MGTVVSEIRASRRSGGTSGQEERVLPVTSCWRVLDVGEGRISRRLNEQQGFKLIRRVLRLMQAENK